MMGADLSGWTDVIRTVRFGHNKPFYWIETPDGKRNHMITRGRLLASLAVLRMNYPHLLFKQVGELPKQKEKRK